MAKKGAYYIMVCGSRNAGRGVLLRHLVRGPLGVPLARHPSNSRQRCQLSSLESRILTLLKARY